MPRIVRDLPDPQATAALARSVARLLQPGDVLALDGPLGSGKTTFVRALAEALGVDPRAVSSPTFVVINVYDVPPPLPPDPDRPASLAPVPTELTRLIHVDAYRLAGSEELDALGWDRLFTPAHVPAGPAAACIEWPQRLGEARPPRALLLRLSHEGDAARRIEFELPPEFMDRPGAELFAQREPRLCPVTRRWVEPLSPTYPFFDERARLSDLFGWFAASYTTSRPPEPDDPDSA